MVNGIPVRPKRDKKLSEELEALKEQQRKERIRELWKYCAVLGGAAVFLALLLAGTLDPVFRLFGLSGFYREQKGIYVDCSAPQNRDSRFCRKEETEQDREWRNLGQGERPIPFSLTE